MIPLIYTGTIPILASVTPIGPPQVFEPPAPPQPPAERRPASPTARRPRVFTLIPAPRSVPSTPINTAEIPDSAIGPGFVPTPFAGVATNGFATSSNALPPVGQPPAPPPPQTKPDPAPAPDKPVPVSGGVLAAKLIHQVLPAYPALARQMRIYGVVRLFGIIGKDGRVVQLRAVSGHPMLAQAALDAVRQWVYRPTVLSGQPVEVEAPIEVIFNLQ